MMNNSQACESNIHPFRKMVLRSSHMLILLSFICMSCTAQNRANTNHSTNEVASNYLNKNFRCALNQSKTLSLCQDYSQKTALQPKSNISYVVIDLKSKKVILQKKIEGGYVKWHDDEHIESFSPPGKMMRGQLKSDFIKITNVNTGEKIRKQDAKKSDD